MRRICVLGLILVVACTSLAGAQGWPSYTMPLVARDGVFLSADHAGALFVTQRPTPYGGAAWIVQVEHAQSVLHVAGVVRAFGPQDTNVVDAVNMALNVNCVVGCAASTPGPIPHITSVTHVAGGFYLTNRAGMAVTVTGTALDVNCTGCSAASVTAVSHISAMAHISGSIVGFGKQNTDVVDVANASLKVSQSAARWPVSHVTSVTHVTLGRSPQFTMMVANCGTGASTVLQANPNRRKLILQNSGEAHIAVGGGHVTVTIANGFLLMSSTTFPAPAVNVIRGWNNSRLELDDYQGPIQCIGQGANQRLDILQVLQP